MTIISEIARRRTVSFISHPDAGKTTLTERPLRAGGGVQMAGNVRAQGERRRAPSDWRSIERVRRIAVMTVGNDRRHTAFGSGRTGSDRGVLPAAARRAAVLKPDC